LRAEALPGSLSAKALPLCIIKAKRDAMADKKLM
jgi:hypothetical protein